MFVLKSCFADGAAEYAGEEGIADRLGEAMERELKTYRKEITDCLDKMKKDRVKYGHSTFEMCQKLLKYAAEEDADELFGIAYYFFAEFYLAYSNQSRVIYCVTEGIKYYRSAQMYDYLARAYNLLGVVAESEDNQAMALENYMHAIDCAKKYQLHYIHAMAESNMANKLIQLGRIEEALGYLKKAERHYGLCEEGPYLKWNLILLQIEMGRCYEKLGRWQESICCLENINRITADMEKQRLPILDIEVFRAGICYTAGDWERAEEALDRAVIEIANGVSVVEYSDSIFQAIDMLLEREKYAALEEILNYLSWMLRENNNKGLLLKVYEKQTLLYKRTDRHIEYVHSVKKYMKLYAEISEDGRRNAVLQSVELRNRLRQIRQENKEMDKQHKKLLSTVRHDPMTGLHTRGYLTQYAAAEFDKAYAGGKMFGVGMLDIDYFKQYNDRYGHLEGDSCIEKVAQIIRSEANEKIFCARYGGDEFVMVYYDMDKKEIKEVAERLCQNVRELKLKNEDSPVSDYITISMGVFYKIPSEVNRLWDYLERADMELYKVKKEKRNGYSMTDSFRKK